MATGVGMGFDLEGLDKALKSADKHLQDLAKQAEVQTKRISDAFSLGATKGIHQMMQELSNVKDGLAELTRQDYKIKLSSNNFGQEVIDEVNRVINYTRAEFERLNKDKVAQFLTPNSYGSAPNINLDDIKSIQDRLAALSSAQSSGFLGFTQIDDRLRVQINDEIQALNERLKVLQMTTEEFNKMKSSEASKIMQTAQMQVDATNAELQRIEREKQAKLDAISAEATAEQEYQQRMQNVAEQRRQRENSAMQEQLRQYEQSKQQVKELEEVRATAQRIMVGSSNGRLAEDARATYASVEEQLRLHKERMQEIERKYPVETTLINQDAANKDFVKQAKEYEDAKEKARKEALTKAQKAEEDAYQLWLARKSAEATEHKRIEEEKYQATVATIRKQNEAFAAQEAERVRILGLQAQQRETNEQVKNSPARTAYEEQLRAYGRLFDEIDAKEEQQKNKHLASQKQMSDAEEKRYNEWLEQKEKEVQQHEDAERRKYNATMSVIARQNAKYREQSEKEYANSVQGSLASYNQLYSPQGVRSLNEMKTVLKQLETAQANINRATKEGQRDWKQVGDAIKRVKSDIESTEKEMGKFHSQQRGILDTSGQLARALAAAFSVSAIKGYVNKLMQIRGEFELQQRSLQVLLQNKDEANALWDKTVALAVKSPYTTKQLVTATKQLAAYRIESEKLYETNKMLADVSIGLGVDMNRLILAFGQVKAANFLRGTELRQFSEAGVNMLDELAKRFTALEGRAVSVGEVFERVSKRMVSFKDVEAVFKTITSEGGVFYQMQEKQSETLKGMMLNLKDSYELMLNDIGKSNEGMLKGFVSMMKTLVDNWQEIVFVVEKIGYALLTYTAVTKLAQLGTTKMAQTFLKFTGITTQSVKSLNLFQKVLTGIGMLGAGTVLAGLIYGFLEIWRVSTKANREAERLQKELQEIYRTDYSEFKQQINTFNELVEKLKDVNQGSEEHREIIQKLNSQYGEYLGFVVTEATTYDKLRSSIDGVNQALLRKAKMSTYEKAYTKIFDETNKTIDEGIEKLKSDIKRVTVTKGGSVVLPTEDEINDIVKILEERLKNLGKQTPLWSDVQEAFKEYGLEIEQIRGWSNSSLYDWKNALITQKEAELKLEQQINAQYSDTTAKTIEHRNALKQIDEIEKSRLEKAKKQGDTSSIAYQKEADKIKKEAQILRIQAQVQYEGLDENVAKKRIAELNKFSNTVIDINKKIEKSADKLGEKYASIIYIDEAEAETGISQIAESTAQSYKTMQDVIKQQNALKEAGTVYDQDILENAQKTAAAYYYKLQLLGRLDLLQKDVNKKETKALKLLNKQLSALKESKQTFDRLRQKFGLEEATKKTAKAFEDLFKELVMTEFTIDMTFDNQGIIDVIDKLPNKAGKAGKQAMEKLKAEMAGGVDVDVKARKDEDLLRQIESMFSGYELTIELQKLNIPPDLAKQLFNVDSISLPELKNQLVGMEDLFRGTEMEKQYRVFLQNVSEMEQKEQEERLKKYIKYLEKAQTERVRIRLEEAKQLAEIDETFVMTEDMAKKIGLTDEQWNKYKDIKGEVNKETLKELGLEDDLIAKIIKQNELLREQAKIAKAGVIREANEKEAKARWKAFESSPEIVSMFGNLESMSNKSLRGLRDRIVGLKSDLIESGLPASELKKILEQIAKVEAQISENNPFENFKDSYKNAFDFYKNRKAFDDANADVQKKRGELEAAETEFINYQKNTSTTDWNINKYNELANAVEKARKDLEDAEKTQVVADNKFKKSQAATQLLSARYKMYSEAINDVTDSLQDMLSALGVLSDEDSEILDGIQSTINNIANIGANIGKIALNPLDISAYVGAITSLFGVISDIAGTGDAMKERKIQKEVKAVERLTKQYEQLEEAIDRAYSLDTLKESNRLAQENIEQQIQATQRMITLEESKKKTDKDKIQQWRDEMDELGKKQEELTAMFLEEVGGVGGESNYKSIAEDFTDAWLNAFYETGDGLTALEENFDEFIKDIVKKQVVQRVAGGLLAPLLQDIDAAAGDGLFDEKEFADVMDKASEIFPEFNERMKETLEAMGMSDWAGKQGELGSLSAGIQGITSEQSDILASYLNSIRFFVADSNTQLKALVAAQGVDADVPNPMLTQLLAIAEQTRAIRDLFDSVVVGGHKMGRSGIKVFID